MACHAGNHCSILKLPDANHFEVLEGFKTIDGVMTKTLLSLLDGKLPPSRMIA